LAQDASDIQASIVSPSKSRVAILRQTSDQDKKKFIEIWAGDRLEVSREVSSTHGTFLTEGELVSGNADAS
jgi:acylaminoacyl-peptidase